MNSVFYVGMDVHKESISLSAFENNCMNPCSEVKINNTLSQLRRYFERLKSKSSMIISCYEAGPTGFTLYRQLQDMGVACYVVAPSMLPRKPGDRIKTDRKDALLLAKALRNQEITPIYVPTPSDEATRDYLRMYSDMKDELKRHKQHLMHFLLRIGKKYPGKTAWTRAHFRWLASLEFDQAIHKMTYEEYFTAVCESEEKVKRILERVEEMASTKEYAERVGKLCCFKGVATITAMTFIAEVGDFRRFPTAKGFMAYLGLVPSEYSSGNTRRIGSITKAGNSRLRKLLIEAGWHYRMYRPTKKLADKRRNQKPEIIAYANKAGQRLNKKYTRMIFRGIRPQITVTAIARELSGFIWGMMVEETAV